MPTPHATRYGHVDLDAIAEEYRAGEPVTVIADRHGVTAAWTRRHLAKRGVKRQRSAWWRPSRWPELDDRRWLLRQIAAGVGLNRIAQKLGCSIGAVRTALRRHGIELPPRDADAVDRLAYIDDPEIRLKMAVRIERDALALAARAARVRRTALTKTVDR